MFIRIVRKLVLLGTLIILLAVPHAGLQANGDVYVVVKLAAGTDITQLSADYQMTLLDSIPALSLYRFMGNDDQLPVTLAADGRVLFRGLRRRVDRSAESR
jgi:hypothetical protein